MAKQSGVGWTTLSVDDSTGTAQPIKNDILSFNFGTPRGVWNVTGIDKSATERLLLLADFSISLTGAFNPATDQSHDVFKTVPSTSVARTVTLTVGGATLPNECMFSDYALTRAATGELTFSAPGALSDGTAPLWA